MTSRTFGRTLAVAVVCASVGGAAGIAGSSAASHKKTTKSSHKTTNSSTAPAGRPPMGGPGMRAVHAEEVVLDKAGDAFITQTEDNGTVVSVSGDQLTITEGTKTVTYKTQTLTIPSGATILRDGKTAALTDFATGDHVQVTSSSDGTEVMGGDASFKPAGGPGGHGGPGGPGQMGGTPPSGATPPSAG